MFQNENEIVSVRAHMFRIACAMLRNSNAAEDCVQDALIKLCRYNYRPDDIMSLSAATIRRVVVDHIRKARARETRVALVEQAVIESAPVNTVVGDTYNRLMDASDGHINGLERRILHSLLNDENVTAADIAAEFNKTEDSVWKAKERLIAKMRDVLNAD